jgi:hypothetical protein
MSDSFFVRRRETFGDLHRVLYGFSHWQPTFLQSLTQSFTRE